MKKLLLILCLIVPNFVHAQIAGQTWTSGTPNFFSENQINPVFDSSGNLTSFKISTTNNYPVVNNITGQTLQVASSSKSFDLIVLGTTTVTADNVTITYKQLADLIVAACLQQNPLPAVTTNNAK
jgi:hypothetical protein